MKWKGIRRDSYATPVELKPRWMLNAMPQSTTDDVNKKKKSKDRMNKGGRSENEKKYAQLSVPSSTMNASPTKF